jgi:hypothetical protein
VIVVISIASVTIKAWTRRKMDEIGSGNEECQAGNDQVTARGRKGGDLIGSVSQTSIGTTVEHLRLNDRLLGECARNSNIE